LVVERKDVEAALEARRELGREYEPEVIDAFLEKIDRRLVLGSIALGIPVTAISLGHGLGGIAVAIVAWVAIAIANLAAMFRR
jgi:hypothetical protein